MMCQIFRQFNPPIFRLKLKLNQHIQNHLGQDGYCAQSLTVLIFLEPWAASDKLKAKQVHSTLEMCNLKRIVDAVELHYDPDPLATNIKADVELMKIYNVMPDEEQEIMAQASPWLLRLIIIRDMLVDKGDAL